MNKKWMLSGLVLVLAGCGGDDTREPYAEPDYLTDQGGYAADGYLVGATVCLDTNKDLSCTGERYSATTDENGQFSLYAQGSLFDKYEVIVEAIAGVTVDLDNPGTPITKGYTLRAPAGLKDTQEKIPVTPISTVLAAEKDAAPDKTVLEVINDSGFAEQLCPLANTEAEKKDCITGDYVKNADSTDDTTRVLAQRKQLTARVMASMLADAQEKAGDSKDKKAASKTLAAKSNQVVNQVDNAIGENGGNTDGVDTDKLAQKNSIVGGEGSNALVNASEVPSQATTALEAFKAPGFAFRLNDTAITGDRIEGGGLGCGFSGCSERQRHTLKKGFPISDWSAPASRESGYLRQNGGLVKLTDEGFLYDTVVAEFETAAQKLNLEGRSVGQLMDAFAPSANRQWRHVLSQCSVFGAGNVAHITKEPLYYQVNNAAYGYYSIIPAAVVPGSGLPAPDFYEMHDIETIISNFTASVGAFSVFVGPDVYVTLADGSAEFFKVSTGTSLGTVSYQVKGISTLFGTARSVIIQDLQALAAETLYIDQTKEYLGIAVSRDSSIEAYKPAASLGTESPTGFGVGVFGSNAASAPRLWLNTAAAETLAAAVDVSALANPAADADSTVDCDYTVKAGTDSDGDGVDDGEDAFPNDAAESKDTDGDGTGDNADSDRDGDGVPNDSDAFPSDPTETKDSDGDGVGDNADSDRDGDGVLNEADAFPDDASESGDLDGDGVGDSVDPDRDGDGINNDEDDAPDDPNSGSDLDGDGIDDSIDADRDGDGVNNDQDAFPDDATETSDLDGDGVGDNSDVDRDGDTVWNDQDAFPDDPTEFSDLDGDGTGDNSDTDRDGDGVNNDVDAFPNDPTETMDSDGDGVGDNSDPTPNGGGADTDGDGFEDTVDAFPNDPAEWEDFDGDGVGDNSDPDPFDPTIPGDGFCDPVIDPLCDPLGF